MRSPKRDAIFPFGRNTGDLRDSTSWLIIWSDRADVLLDYTDSTYLRMPAHTRKALRPSYYTAGLSRLE